MVNAGLFDAPLFVRNLVPSPNNIIPGALALRSPIFRLIVGLASLFGSLASGAQPITPYPFDGILQSPIQEHYLYLCDSGSLRSPADALAAFRAGKGLVWRRGATFNQGFTHYRYWFLLPVTQKSIAHQQPLLEIASVVYRLQISRVAEQGIEAVFDGSTSVAFHQRPFKHREFVMPLNIASGTTDSFLICADYRERNMRLSMQIEDFQTVFVREAAFSKRFGIYMGILLFILVFNIVLAVSLRSGLHAWYVVYIAAAIVYAVFDFNMDSLLFPNTSTRFSDAVGGLPFDELLVAAALKFMQMFIRQEKGRSPLYWPVCFFIYSCVGIALVYLVLGFTAPDLLTRMPSSIQQLFSYHTILAALMIPASCIRGAGRRQIEATLYLVSSCMPVTGGVVYFLHQIGVIVDGGLAKDGIMIGITVEIAILGIYLVQRYNRLIREKEELLIDLNRKEQEKIKSIVDTLESERKRIAQDLHDDVGATLSALRLHISNIPEQSSDSKALEAYYRKALFLSSKATGDIRSIAHDMVPRDFSGTGLFRALQEAIAEWNDLGKVQFQLITLGDDGRLNHVLSLNIYRIVRELAGNILKHSLASTAVIQVILSPAEAMILAEDNGVGVAGARDEKGIGLKNVQSRTDFLKGQLQMDSNNNGTTFIITIPLPA
jgi:signal transduction histidine kinase